jgi:hypothetical protein
MQLWEWEAVYPDGATHGHQTQESAGIASEAEMLAHLKRCYPNVLITKLRQCEATERKKDRIGPVQYHAFRAGYWDAAMRELGKLPPEKKQTILDRFRRERLARVAGVNLERIRPIRERLPSLIRST